MARSRLISTSVRPPAAECRSLRRTALDGRAGGEEPTLLGKDDKVGGNAGVLSAHHASKVVTFEELSRHSTAESLWIAISGKVYDLTGWGSQHPGGLLPLLAAAGGDATDVFRAMHPPQVWSQLTPFLVGPLEPMSPAPEPGSCQPSAAEQELIRDYRQMYQQIKKQGLDKPDRFYFLRALALVSAFCGIWAGVMCFSSPVVHMVCAAALGLWWQQVNFVGHDAGHNAITGDRRVDSAIGYLVGNTLTGISIGWWKRSHNVHHVVCNSINFDSDIQHMPLFAISKEMFKPQYSFYHFRQMTFDAAAQLLVSYQHLTFYPIMAIARLNLYIQSLLLFFSKDRLDNRMLEGATMLAFWAWYTTLLLQLPSWPERVAFFFLSHAVTGVLHVQ